MKVFILILLYLVSSVVYSSTAVVSENCKIVVVHKGPKFKSVLKMLKERLKESNYNNIKMVLTTSEVKNVELYLKLSVETRGKGLFPPCIGIVELYKKHKQIYREEKKRTRPRVTFKGESRCRLVTRDVLEFLPRCESLKMQGSAGQD